MHQPGIRRELSRQNMSFFDYITQSTAWMWIDLVSGLWCTYAMATGLLCWLIKSKQMFCQGTKKYTCCQIFISSLSSLDAAVNPLNLTKIKFKWKIREISANVMSLQTVVDEMMLTMRSVMDRMTELERRLSELEAASGRKNMGATEFGNPGYGLTGDTTKKLRQPKQSTRKLSAKKQSLRLAPRNIMKLGAKMATAGRRVKFADDVPPVPPPRSRKGSFAEDLPPPPSQAEMDSLSNQEEEQKLLLNDQEGMVTVTRPRLGRAGGIKTQVHSPPTAKKQAPPPPTRTTPTLKRHRIREEEKE